MKKKLISIRAYHGLKDIVDFVEGKHSTAGRGIGKKTVREICNLIYTVSGNQIPFEVIPKRNLCKKCIPIVSHSIRQFFSIFFFYYK